MRAVTGLALAAVLAVEAGVLADEPAGKLDVVKLVGRWEPTDLPKGAKAMVEFAKDGRLFVHNEYAGQAYRLEGTYKVDGNKLAVTMKREDGKNRQEFMTVAKLTEDELVMQEAGTKKPDTLKRVKVKK